MKIRGLLVSGVFLLAGLLAGLSVFGCQGQKPKESASLTNYEVVAAVPSQTSVKMIGTVELLESSPEANIAEFTGGPWTIAVKNLSSGYTYYYGSGNTFLGRRK